MSRMKLLTTVQFARVLGVGRATIYRWLSEGQIVPSIKHEFVQVAGERVFQPMAWTEQDVKRIQQWMAKNYRPDKAKGGRK
jgi:excisionase family DNA binding protein